MVLVITVEACISYDRYVELDTYHLYRKKQDAAKEKSSDTLSYLYYIND